MWNRYERWFDLDTQLWQEGWRGSGGRLRGVTPSVRTHSSKSTPFSSCTRAHVHTSTHRHMHMHRQHTYFKHRCTYCYKRFALNLSLSLCCLTHRYTQKKKILSCLSHYCLFTHSRVLCFSTFKWFWSSEQKQRSSLASCLLHLSTEHWVTLLRTWGLLSNHSKYC